jgi:hypothetical protein
MKRIAIIVGFFFLAGCAPKGQNDIIVTQEQKIAAYNELAACANKQIELQDDGVSDAATIAQAISGPCDKERIAFARLFSINARPQAQAQLLEMSKATTMRDIYIPMVLSHRRTH